MLGCDVRVEMLVRDWSGVISLTFTSKDEKRCFIVAITAAELYAQRCVVYWCRHERGPKNYDEQRCCHRRHAAL